VLFHCKPVNQQKKKNNDFCIDFMGRTKTTVFEAKKGAEILLSLWAAKKCPPFFF
jgi:hypothetical protein